MATPFVVGWLEHRGRAVAGLVLLLLAAELLARGQDPLGAGVLLVIAWVGGRVVHARGVLLERLRRVHAELERQRSLEVATSVLEQRAAVAREVHDSIGHNLTVAALQAGAALRLPHGDPGRRTALRTVDRVLRDARDELHRGFENDPDPQQVLADAQLAGLDLHVSGEMSGADSRIARRVLQESLTNALRHAPGSRVEVCFTHDEAGCALVVTNGPGHPDATGPTGGHGLTWMRERVEGAGGSLEWHATPEGGFTVAARLPVDADLRTRDEQPA